MKKLGKFLWYLIFGVGYLAIYYKYYVPTEWGKKRNTATTGRQSKAFLWPGKCSPYLSNHSSIIYLLSHGNVIKDLREKKIKNLLV